ncbi:MAG: bifunctional oligoribonuclease/PAP phosphatase NrnA [Longimicrobiales bacterium]|nr:bifunctional oligoribonuclease/PAP phosphatase NrnA [Longimicrobiales bacterium]
MTTKNNELRSESVEQVLNELQGKDLVVLTTHKNADGDGCGSQVALASWLRSQGTETFIVNPTPFPENFKFLLPDESWVAEADSPGARELCDGADLVVVLDTGENPRIGKVEPLVRGLPTVVIDHHPIGQNPIRGLSLRDTTASSTGELVYDLIEKAGGPWSKTSDLGVYVAVVSDTGFFKFGNTNPHSLRIAAELVDRGVDPGKVYRRLFGSYSKTRLQLLQSSLASLDLDEAYKTAWMVVSEKAYDTLGATPESLEGFVDYPRFIIGIEVGILFRKVSRNAIKVSLRSNGLINVNTVARKFGGGGHNAASGALIKGSMEEVKQSVIEAVREVVEVSGILK